MTHTIHTSIRSMNCIAISEYIVQTYRNNVKYIYNIIESIPYFISLLNSIGYYRDYHNIVIILPQASGL